MISNPDEYQSSQLVKHKREQFIIEIRKKKNDDLLNAKRFKMTQHKENIPIKTDNNYIARNDFENLSNMFVQNYEEKNFEGLANVLESIRRLLSSSEDPPLKPFLATNICHFIAELLDTRYKKFERIQHEAAWILTNVAYGGKEETALITKLGCIQRFIRLIIHENNEISEQAMWAIANIAGEGHEYRDLCIDYGVVDAIIDKINGKDLMIPYIRNLSWTISNLCRGKPYPNYDAVSCFLPVLDKLIKVRDDEIRANVMWTLSYLSDGDDDRIEAILKLDIMDNIIECFMDKNNIPLSVPSLRTIGNLLTGNDEQANAVLQYNIIDRLCELLTHTKKVLRKESCWAMSNILAGNHEHIDCVLSNENAIKKLMQILYNDELDIRLEALFCFSNCTYGASMEQIDKLVELELVDVLVEVLALSNHSKLILTGLESIYNILKMGNNYVIEDKFQVNPYAQRLENCGGIKLIEQLQNHPDQNVYNKICSIIDEFFQIV